MSTTLLLIILAVCIVAVLAATGYAGWRTYALFRTASRTARRFSEASSRLAGQAAAAQIQLAEIAKNQASVTANIDDLRVTLARLEVVVSALRRAAAPLRRLTAYLGR